MSFGLLGGAWPDALLGQISMSLGSRGMAVRQADRHEWEGEGNGIGFASRHRTCRGGRRGQFFNRSFDMPGSDKGRGASPPSYVGRPPSSALVRPLCQARGRGRPPNAPERAARRTGTATSLDGAGEEAPQRRVHGFIVRRRRVWPIPGDVVGASGTKRTDFQTWFRPRKPFEGPPPWLCDWIGSPHRGDGGLRRRTLDKLSSARRSMVRIVAVKCLVSGLRMISARNAGASGIWAVEPRQAS